MRNAVSMMGDWDGRPDWVRLTDREAEGEFLSSELATEKRPQHQHAEATRDVKKGRRRT